MRRIVTPFLEDGTGGRAGMCCCVWCSAWVSINAQHLLYTQGTIGHVSWIFRYCSLNKGSWSQIGLVVDALRLFTAGWSVKSQICLTIKQKNGFTRANKMLWLLLVPSSSFFVQAKNTKAKTHATVKQCLAPLPIVSTSHGHTMNGTLPPYLKDRLQKDYWAS